MRGRQISIDWITFLNFGFLVVIVVFRICWNFCLALHDLEVHARLAWLLVHDLLHDFVGQWQVWADCSAGRCKVDSTRHWICEGDPLAELALRSRPPDFPRLAWTRVEESSLCIRILNVRCLLGILDGDRRWRGAVSWWCNLTIMQVCRSRSIPCQPATPSSRLARTFSSSRRQGVLLPIQVGIDWVTTYIGPRVLRCNWFRIVDIVDLNELLVHHTCNK